MWNGTATQPTRRTAGRLPTLAAGSVSAELAHFRRVLATPGTDPMITRHRPGTSGAMAIRDYPNGTVPKLVRGAQRPAGLMENERTAGLLLVVAKRGL